MLFREDAIMAKAGIVDLGGGYGLQSISRFDVIEQQSWTRQGGRIAKRLKRVVWVQLWMGGERRASQVRHQLLETPGGQGHLVDQRL